MPPEWKKVATGLRLIAISTTIMVLVVVVSVVTLGMAAFSVAAGPPTTDSVMSIFVLAIFGLVLDFAAFVLGLLGEWMTLSAPVSRGARVLGNVGVVGKTLYLLSGVVIGLLVVTLETLEPTGRLVPQLDADPPRRILVAPLSRPELESILPLMCVAYLAVFIGETCYLLYLRSLALHICRADLGVGFIVFLIFFLFTPLVLVGCMGIGEFLGTGPVMGLAVLVVAVVYLFMGYFGLRGLVSDLREGILFRFSDTRG